MDKRKLRTVLNVFIGIVFLIYIPIALSFDYVDAKWSMGFVIFISLFYLVRDIIAPKEKITDKTNTKDRWG